MWSLLDELRAAAPFQRLTFERSVLEFTRSVFPNQPPRRLEVYKYQSEVSAPTLSNVRLLIDGSETTVSSRRLTHLPFLRSISNLELLIPDKSNATLRMHLAWPSIVATELSPDLEEGCALALFAAAGRIAVLNRLTFYVAVDHGMTRARKLLARREFKPLPDLFHLDEWYFCNGAHSIRRSDLRRILGATQDTLGTSWKFVQ
jgi:hypothetical protein